MRHRVVSSTFGLSVPHRKAMLVALVCSLIDERRIKTTLPRARAARRLAERMVTLAKAGTVASRRKAASVLQRKSVVNTLFNDIAPQCQDRAGGYVRITKTGQRKSDNSTMAVMEWVTIKPMDKKKKRPPEEKEKSGENPQQPGR